MKILDIIKQELKDFEEPIQIVNGLSFNQKSTIDTIYYYYLSKFETGQIDTEGFRKYFYNLVKMPCRVETKEIQFDTKHIRFLTPPGQSTVKTWYLERDFNQWVKENEFGLLLNRIFQEIPRFGSCVIKLVNNKPFFVDLRNFVVQQDADSLPQSSHIIEIHRYNPLEFEKVAKERNWENANEALEEYKKSDKNYITVYERYGEIDGEYKKVLIADAEDILDERTGEVIAKAPDIILAEQSLSPDELPYFEFHREKIPGRWLGLGKIEELIEPQIRINELANLKVKASYWATLQLFQTRDENVNRNLLTQVKNGEVLNVESEITKIGTEERNLAAYNQEEERWLQNRDEISLTYEVLRGERLPAGTPLGSATLAATMMRAYYGFLQQNLALAVKQFLYKLLSQFDKYISKEHTLNLVGEDLEVYRKMLIQNKTYQRIRDFVIDNLKIPDEMEQEILRTTVAQMQKREKGKKEETVTLPEGFYENLKYKIDIVIAEEQIDTRLQVANLQMVLQAITADPTLLRDPTRKKILSLMLERAGIRVEDVLPTEEIPTPSEVVSRLRAGGGISRPSFPSIPVPGETTKTR